MDLQGFRETVVITQIGSQKPREHKASDQGRHQCHKKPSDWDLRVFKFVLCQKARHKNGMSNYEKMSRDKAEHYCNVNI